VHAIFTRYGYSPVDDTSFANRVFDPAAVDPFFVAPGDIEARLLEYHSNTNYSVVDPELIEDVRREPRNLATRAAESSDSPGSGLGESRLAGVFRAGRRRREW
jgi:hypothetical protein